MARPAAQAAMAASAQGKFWQYHDKIFAQFNQINEQKLTAFAEELKLDIAKFNRDRSAPQVLNQINEDMRLAQVVGLRGTPTVFINGLLLQGRSLQDASQMIDAELSKLGHQ